MSAPASLRQPCQPPEMLSRPRATGQPISAAVRTGTETGSGESVETGGEIELPGTARVVASAEESELRRGNPGLAIGCFGWGGRIRTCNLPGNNRTCCQTHPSPNLISSIRVSLSASPPHGRVNAPGGSCGGGGLLQELGSPFQIGKRQDYHRLRRALRDAAVNILDVDLVFRQLAGRAAQKKRPSKAEARITLRLIPMEPPQKRNYITTSAQLE